MIEPENERTTIFRNVENYSPKDKASNPRRCESVALYVNLSAYTYVCVCVCSCVQLTACFAIETGLQHIVNLTSSNI